MLKALSAIWYNNGDDVKTIAHAQAEKLRKFDDNHFNRAIYLNDSTGANGKGHNAVMLINENDYAVVFSFYPQGDDVLEVLIDPAEVRFAVLTPDEMNNVLYGDGEITNMIASDGEVQTETYDRYIYYDISNGQGYNMYHEAISVFDMPGTYYLVGRQCDDFATNVLDKGGIEIDWNLTPNGSYEKEKKKRKK